MRTIGWICLLPWFVMGLCACTHLGRAVMEEEQGERTPTERFLSLAQQYETDAPAEALLYLKIAAALDPEIRNWRCVWKPLPNNWSVRLRPRWKKSIFTGSKMTPALCLSPYWPCCDITRIMVRR